MYNLMLSLLKLIDKYNSKLNELYSRYYSLAQETLSSLEESREYYENEEANRKRNSGSGVADVIERMSCLLERADLVIRQLAQRDKAFKRFMEAYVNQDTYIISQVSEVSGYVAFMEKLLTQIEESAGKVLDIIGEFPLKRIFHRKIRREHYENILELYSQAVEFVDYSCNQLLCKASRYWGQISSEIDVAVLEAESDTRVLLNSIISELKDEKQRLLVSFSKELSERLTASFMKNIELQLGVSEYEISETFQPFLNAGYFAKDISSLNYLPEIQNILAGHAGSLIQDNVIIFPALFDSRYANNFRISYTVKDSPKDKVLSLILSLLRKSPAGGQRFILSDPEYHSENFKPILDFILSAPELMGQHILTTKTHIKEALYEINEFIDTSAQRQFAWYSDIFEYNSVMKDNPEHYRTLVFMDFPKYFDTEMLDLLRNIIRNGTPYGVGTIISINDRFIDYNASDEYFTLLDDISEKSILIRIKNGSCFMEGDISFIPHSFEPEVFAIVSQHISEEYISIKSKGIPFSRITGNNSIGIFNSLNKLSIPFAVDETGKIKSLEVGDTVASGISHYVLVTGSTGSGKSTMLHSIIMSAVYHYPPDELSIYLMDFKNGLEFKIYSERKVPHIKLLAMDTLQEFGLSILQELMTEMDRRMKIFREVANEYGCDIRSITDYRTVTGRKIPRILLIIDEFQRLFDGDSNRRIALSCGNIIANLVSLARVYGIHFIFATQTLARIYSGAFTIPKATLNEFHVRIGLNGTKDEANLLFGTKNGDCAFTKYGQEKGKGVYINDDTCGVPVGFKSVYCSIEEQGKLLEELAKFYADYPIQMRVFLGTLIPDISDAPEYKTRTSHEEFLLLGEPVSIRPSITIALNSRNKSNIFIAGTNYHMMNSLIDLCLLSVKLFFPKDTKCYYIDSEILSGNECQPQTESIIRTTKNIITIKKENEFIQAIREINDAYILRKSSRKSSGRIIVIIKNLQWLNTLNKILQGKFRDLQPVIDDDDPFSFVTGSVTKRKHPNDLSDRFDAFEADVSSYGKGISDYRSVILDIMENGYFYGIHFIMTASDFISVRDYMYDVISNFTHRIIFSLSENDAGRLIPDAMIQVMPDNIALYYDGISNVYQFKPFSCKKILQEV